MDGSGALCHLRDALDTKRRAVQRILWEDEPQLGSVEVEAPHAGDNQADAEAVVSELAAKAERLAELIEATPGQDWARVGTRGDQEVSALHIVYQAVHECAHHLREAKQALADAQRLTARSGATTTSPSRA